MSYIQRDALNRSIEQRRSNVSNQQAVGPSVARVCGTFAVSGAGELTQFVPFPFAFVERPSVSFGFELPAGEPLVDGKYPTCSIGVARWLVEQRGGSEYYSGATLVVVTTGPESQTLIAHWQAEALSISHPIA